MGTSIDLYSYDYEKLVNKTMKVCKTEDRNLVEKILLNCGNKIADKYVILNQEFWDGYSCYYNVARVLEKVFDVEDEDVFSEVFCWDSKNEVNKQELISSVELYQIAEDIGVETDDSWYE